jgi:hypothetical protein
MSQLGMRISEIKMFCARMTTARLPTNAPSAVSGKWTFGNLLLKAHNESIVIVTLRYNIRTLLFASSPLVAPQFEVT